MKNHHITFFLIGILVGGILMLLFLGFVPGGKASSSHEIMSAPTLDSLPHLIALEPTTSIQKATPTPVIPTITASSSLVPAQATGSLTPTPLVLQNKQQTEIIGYSVEARPLEVYAFGKGLHQRMIVAGIHGGDEWNTVTLANQLIQYLNQNPGAVPEDVTLYILPNLNPDGEARAHNKYGRLNQNSVDLNRNFPVNWQQDWARAGCWNSLPSSGGTSPGSEPETQGLMQFIEAHKVEALISYHSAALGIFPGGMPWDEKSTHLAQSIAEVTSYPFPPLDTGCAYSGTLADYAVSKGVAAVDLELTNHFDPDFGQNLDVLNVLLNFIAETSALNR